MVQVFRSSCFSWIQCRFYIFTVLCNTSRNSHFFFLHIYPSVILSSILLWRLKREKCYIHIYKRTFVFFINHIENWKISTERLLKYVATWPSWPITSFVWPCLLLRRTPTTGIGELLSQETFVSKLLTSDDDVHYSIYQQSACEWCPDSCLRASDHMYWCYTVFLVRRNLSKIISWWSTRLLISIISPPAEQCGVSFPWCIWGIIHTIIRWTYRVSWLDVL